VFKYIFAFLVVAIAWAAALVLKDKLPHGFDIAIAVTVLTVLVLVGLVLYRKYRARKAAREIEKALNAQAEEHARTVRPSSRPRCARCRRRSPAPSHRSSRRSSARAAPRPSTRCPGTSSSARPARARPPRSATPGSSFRTPRRAAAG
jgi:hypothetical protein